ncbi:MAG: PEP-CTERM sorting domain-containing protein [Armatimonadota bacterium]
MKLTRVLKIAVAVMILGATAASATPYEFNSVSGKTAWIDVDAWAGSGANESILVVDWNIMGGPYQTESHAFGFRWDGTAYESDMLNALNNAGVFTVTSGYGGAFLEDIVYNDGVDHHTHADELGSWNLASTSDPYAKWGAMSSDWTKLGDWNANMAGYNQELLANGQLEGINAIQWFSGDPNVYPLNVPFVAVPEPGSLIAMVSGLIGMGGLVMRRRVS